MVPCVACDVMAGLPIKDTLHGPLVAVLMIGMEKKAIGSIWYQNNKNNLDITKKPKLLSMLPCIPRAFFLQCLHMHTTLVAKKRAQDLVAKRQGNFLYMDSSLSVSFLCKSYLGKTQAPCVCQ